MRWVAGGEWRTDTVGVCSQCTDHLVVSYLFVNLGELLKVVLKEGDLLLLGRAAAGVVRVHLSALRRHTRNTLTVKRTHLLTGTRPDTPWSKDQA